ncbi:MAG: hypothetical protein ROM54_05995, partial [Anaerobiospirillum sp.]|nr:hypothetical protein [Anaerobiospirillum sp.]
MQQKPLRKDCLDGADNSPKVAAQSRSIGHGVEFGLYEHPLHNVTTSPALSRNIFFMERSGAIPFNPAQLRSDGLETNVVTLGNDVWVGGHCLFPKDVTIGHGAVIG